jgi:hypothetical protein
MKKYISFMIMAGLVLSFSLAPAAQAQTDSGKIELEGKAGARAELGGERQEARQEFRVKLQADRQDFMAQLQADRVSFMAEVKARREAWQNDNADRKAKFCEAAREAFINRFEAATSRLEMYQDKTADIIVEVKASGKDTAEAQASLDLSLQKLADAKAKLASLKDQVPADCAKLTAEQFEALKVGARDAKDLLKESRQALHEAIQDLKSLSVDVSVKGSIKN